MADSRARARDKATMFDALAAEAEGGVVDIGRASQLLGTGGRVAALSLGEVAAAWNARHPRSRVSIADVQAILREAHRKLREVLRGCL